MTTTTEITVYQQGDMTYCEECKPRGGKPSTLVLSNYDHFCDGCGQDLKEMAEEDDDELSPEDLTAINHAMSQEDMGPYTFAELEHLLTQAHNTTTCDCNTCRTTRKRHAQQAERERVSYLAIEERFTGEEQALLDAAYERAVKLGRPFEKQEVFQPVWDAGIELSPQMDSRFILVKEATGKTARLWGVKPAPQPETLYTVEDDRLALPIHYLTPNAVSPEWYSPKRFSGIKEASDAFVAHHGKPARYVDPYQFGVLCKLRMEEWEAWEGVPCHVDRYRHFHDVFASFCQAVAMYASQQIDPFTLDIESAWDWQKADRAFMEWEVEHPQFVAIV